MGLQARNRARHTDGILHNDVLNMMLFLLCRRCLFPSLSPRAGRPDEFFFARASTWCRTRAA